MQKNSGEHAIFCVIVVKPARKNPANAGFKYYNLIYLKSKSCCKTNSSRLYIDVANQVKFWLPVQR